ncbi:hypothetical protein [Lysobacter enzymogenes]|uniref:DUF4760 domain-containing protein n=1 Tax=Lysobacter enzymogenes TaxID=69 RepID=A0A3N2RPP0_LYSEN|nr:hypothetical protein [Lysobacter enzymogenes]ROU09440.1 hypothetical protein D9T17_01030 [Lysobacter enzymogenes]
MEFCPQEVAFGNVADWVAAIVAAVVGYLVWKLTAAANRIATESHDARIAADRREAIQIVMVSYATLQLASSALNLVDQLFARVGSKESFIRDKEFREQIKSVISDVRRPTEMPGPDLLARIPGREGNLAYHAWHYLDLLFEQLRIADLFCAEHIIEQAYENMRSSLPKAIESCATAKNALIEAMHNLEGH